jgi:hypothetical protein
LLTDSWDDWFKYSTLYHLHIADAGGEWHDIGMVKIGEFGMEAEQRTPALPSRFARLGEAFFSLGQDDTGVDPLSLTP